MMRVPLRGERRRGGVAPCGRFCSIVAVAALPAGRFASPGSVFAKGCRGKRRGCNSHEESRRCRRCKSSDRGDDPEMEARRRQPRRARAAGVDGGEGGSTVTAAVAAAMAAAVAAAATDKAAAQQIRQQRLLKCASHRRREGSCRACASVPGRERVGCQFAPFGSTSGGLGFRGVGVGAICYIMRGNAMAGKRFPCGRAHLELELLYAAVLDLRPALQRQARS